MARLDAPLPADLTSSRRSFSWGFSGFPRVPSVQRPRHRTLSIGTQEKPLRNVKAATDDLHETGTPDFAEHFPGAEDATGARGAGGRGAAAGPPGGAPRRPAELG